ncbi:hypothetical protein [Tenacibaculum sp. 190524A02b]|uniref:Uncharacterized protein n=1 Tax=Tenacibaculum vairaonense TaxID=3137860 RepID=A0ABM9PP86_9FLAO
MMKISFLKYFTFLICIILYFGSDFIPKYNKEYFKAKEVYDVTKKKNTKALTKLKEYSKNTQLYQDYLDVNKEKNLAFKNYKKEQKNNEVNGFISLKVFLERFSLILLIFLYAMHNLIKSLYYEQKNIGNLIIHGIIISVCVFNFFWIFQKFQNFSKVTYLLMTLLTALFVVIAVYLITKRKKTYVNTVKDRMLQIAKKALLNSRPEKRKEMLDFIEQIAKEK